MENLNLIWSFLTSGLLGYVLLAFGIVAGFLLSVVVFLAACALADVDDPGFLKACLMVLATYAVCVPVVYGLSYLYAGVPLPSFVPGWVGVTLLAAVCLAATIVVAAVLYIVLLRISVKKGGLVAVLGQALGSLLAALLWGILLVILAVVQIVSRPAAPPKADLPPAAPPARAVVS